MDMENINGLINQLFKANMSKTKNTVLENMPIQTERYLKGNGEMEEGRDMVP